ncbi:hypothetical protein RJ55_03787 [Drechmeria coniospora]|nr:hypothetical protein RJ55_03787 [Drechmeria coniospora]
MQFAALISLLVPAIAALPSQSPKSLEQANFATLEMLKQCNFLQIASSCTLLRPSHSECNTECMKCGQSSGKCVRSPDSLIDL